MRRRPGAAGESREEGGELETRRDRLRAATVREISGTARRILVEEGPEAVTLRAIAREMGMTASALYRYFDSHEALLIDLMAATAGELGDALRAAIAAAETDDPGARLVTATREFRRWALSNQAEYALLFGEPPRDLTDDQCVTADCWRSFGAIFYELFADLWARAPFDVPGADQIDPALRAQLTATLGDLGVTVPIGAALVFLRCWVRIQGIVTLEVFGHLRWAVPDAEAMFEDTLADLARALGIPVTGPDR